MNSEAKTIRQFAELIRAGHKLDFNPNQFSNRTSRDLQQLLAVNQKAGGPMAATLDRFATVLSLRAQAQIELELAVAGPTASSRLVMSLPILVFLGAGIAGIPIFRTLASPSIVWVSLAIGAGMFWFGSRWTNSILRKAKPEPEDPGLPLDSLGVAIMAGLPLATASEIVGGVEISELQELSLGSGIALSELVANRADALRLEKLNSDRLRIQKASVSVLWPLGLTVLPAFVLIAIVPIGLALLHSQ